METKLASAQKKLSVAAVINQLRMLLVLIGLVAIFSILSPHFLSANNFSAIGLTISVIGIVCIGQSIALLTGDFDLSVGSVAGFCGIVVAQLTKNHGMYPLMLLVGIGLGALIGLVNGLLVAKAKVNALITTLGMMTIFQGQPSWSATALRWASIRPIFASWGPPNCSAYPCRSSSW